MRAGLQGGPSIAGATKKSAGKVTGRAKLERTKGPECSKSRMIPANNGYTGVYTGMIPYADCEGIQYRLALNAYGSFQEQLTYKGKSAICI